jgi:hypothetical protein
MGREAAARGLEVALAGAASGWLGAAGTDQAAG